MGKGDLVAAALGCAGSIWSLVGDGGPRCSGSLGTASFLFTRLSKGGATQVGSA